MTQKIATSSPYPWFEKRWSEWLSQYRQDLFPNALLLSGPPGIGKVSLAESLTSLLLCLAPTASGACGECKACLLTEAGTHPDVRYIYPEEKSRAVKIDQIRELGEFIHGRPQIGSRIVAVIAPADAMNLYSANALLKTLEEPPAGAVIILVTSQMSLLLPTIRSRCQIIKLSAPRRDQATMWLGDHSGLSAEEAVSLLTSANDQPLTALHWQDQQQVGSRNEVLRDWDSFLTGKADAFTLAEKWSKMDVVWVIDWLAGALREGLQQTLSTQKSSDSESNATVSLSADRQWLLYQELIDLKRAVLEQRNLNSQLALENWLLLNKKKLAAL